MNAGKTSKRSILSLALLSLLAIAFLASSVNATPRSQIAALAKSPDSTVFAGTGLTENSSFLLWERDGGMWCDAEKDPLDNDDDLMCWAAAACNVLEWTGWGLVNSDRGRLWTSDEMFDYVIYYWNDTGGIPYHTWHWWFGGYVPDPPEKNAPDKEGGGAFWNSTYNFYNCALYENNDTLIVPKISEWLGRGYGVVIGVELPSGSGGHYLTCWGNNYDPIAGARNASDPAQYLGVWVTESDDDKNVAPPAPDVLHYYEVGWNGTHWLLPNYHSGYCMVEAMALKPFPGARPVASAGPPRMVSEGSSVFLDASGSDPDGDDLQYRWDFNNDGVWDTAWSSSAARADKWNDDYSGMVVLQTHDGHLLDVDSTYVRVTNIAPSVDAGVITELREGEISFSGNFADPGIEDRHIVEWDFGDGSTVSGTLAPTHAYGSDGFYTVTLTVTDDDGGVGTDTLNVTVEGLSSWPMFRHDLSHTGHYRLTGPNNNSTLWKYTTGASVTSSPAVYNGRVYIGSGDNLYCLNALTGAKVWNYTTTYGAASCPAVSGGRVYIGSYKQVYCLNATTGALIWNYTTGYYVDSSPAVADGKVYVGCQDWKLYCLHAVTGNLIWSYDIGTNMESSPAVANGRVYFGCYDHNSKTWVFNLDNVYCLNASTGAKIWSYKTGGDVRSSPAVSSSYVYVGSDDKNVYCLDPVTGDLRWNYTTGGMVRSSPAVVDGKLYVGASDQKVYCLSLYSAGAQLWNYTAGNSVLSSPAYADFKIYIGSSDGKVYCLNSLTGEKIWSYSTGAGVSSSPAVADGKVYVGSEDNKVYAFGAPVIVYSPEFGGVVYPVSVTSNSLISGLSFDQSSKTISMYASNATGTSGMQASCDVSFPTSLLGGPYIVLVDGSAVASTQTANSTHAFLSFSYTHSTRKIEIVGLTAIPELPPVAMLAVLIALTSAVTLAFRKKRKA